MRGMEKTYFWGLTLDGSTKEKTWEGQCVLNNLEATTTTHTLSIRQVVLGPEAKEGEVNVVELEVKGYKDQKHKIPVCVTKAGGSYVTGVDVLIEDTPAIFRLTQGSGPIHLSGTHQVETTIIEDDMDDSLAEEEGEEEDEVEEEVEELPPKKKAKK
ncbi:nucleoplasmin-like protein ANO39 [Penaeus vannamei]|uniref:nucleoplasmin-like protein ANO39 n=1 Tax=Penaeus vannamei TaxID=6689 RepID=UPI00387F4268